MAHLHCRRSRQFVAVDFLSPPVCSVDCGRDLKPVHTVAEKCESRRISPLSRRFLRDSRTFLRQCGQGFIHHLWLKSCPYWRRSRKKSPSTLATFCRPCWRQKSTATLSPWTGLRRQCGRAI